MAESDIQGRILKIVRDTFGWYAHKNKIGSDGANNGWPDLTVYVPGGKPVLLEIKKPGGAASTVQRHVISGLIDHGYPVYIVDNVGHAVRVLRKHFERKK